MNAPFAGVYAVEFYPSLQAKAAVLLYSLAKSQACVDGNKRLAVILLEAFLALNGLTLETEQDDLVDAVLRVSESDRSDRAAILGWLEDWLSQRMVGLEGGS